jgi:CO dehydrogenase/acetyl-CoA synthase beta subunit
MTLKEQEDAKDLEKLRAFYRKVAHATVNHEVLTVPDPEDELSNESYAVVYPATLAKLLAEVNPRWYYTASFDPFDRLSDTSGT